jgi:hypothetical protein
MLRILPLICLATIAATAQEPAAKPVAPKPKKPALLTSDLSGRDLLFISEAADIGKTLTFLAISATKAKTPELRGFSEDLMKSVAAQGAVLTSLADMRSVKVSTNENIAQKKYAARFANLEGNRLDKALLDAFLTTEEQAITTYKLGEKSSDPTIREFVAQTLPQLRQHHAFLQSLAGIPPERALAPVAEGPK